MMDLLYQYNRSLINTGDAIQWRSSTSLGFLIRKFTGGDVNHTALVIRINNYDRVFQLEALKPGIVLTSLSRRLAMHKGEAFWLSLLTRYDDYRPAIGEWAASFVGAKYDYRSLFRQIFGRVSAEASRFFCSEYAYLAWQNSGIPMQNPSGKAPRPCDVPALGIFGPQVKIK